MKVRIHRERPEPWAAKRAGIASAWTVPFWLLEWSFEWIAFALSRWSFLDVLEYLEGFSVLIAVIFYFSESGDRLKQKHYQAWQVINTAQGKGGNGGRVDALEELNSDGISLIGVDVSGAFLQNVRLERARLSRASFGAADLRNSDFASADFSGANLFSANLRQSNLRNASLQGAHLEKADLSEADLSGADLTGVDSLEDADLSNATLSNLHWGNITSIKNANIFGVKNAPAGFVAWAMQHGAVSTKSDTE
jgi:Pentapeptide repeats (8 copies)